jgi:hypothetical protein
MKEIREILSEVFDSVAISIIVGFFIGLTIVFLIIGDSFLVAVGDLLFLTIGLAMVIFLGGYVKYLERRK